MKKRTVSVLAVVAALASLAAFSAACSDGKDDGSGIEPSATSVSAGTPRAGTEVNVNLTEYTVFPDVATVPAGSVTFNASNIGGEDHELVILKTDLAEDALPANDDGSADEAGAGVEAIDTIAPFAKRGEESLTVDLDAGNYVLICNIVRETAAGTPVSHYHEGMHATFVVTE